MSMTDKELRRSSAGDAVFGGVDGALQQNGMDGREGGVTATTVVTEEKPEKVVSRLQLTGTAANKRYMGGWCCYK